MTTLNVTIKRPQDRRGLEASWRALEKARADRPFFLSWEWAATAIKMAEDSLYVAEAKTANGQCVGLGLLCSIVEKRHGFIRMRQLRLNEVGDTAEQTVPVEYNSFLTAPGYETAVWEAGLAALQKSDAPQWDEFIVTNALTSIEDRMSANGRLIHRRAESTSGFVELNALRQGGVKGIDDYLATLGRNTRSQIKRSIRLYEEKGPVGLSRASTLAEAKDYFTALGELHETKWRARGATGIISDKHFWNFHTTLIERCFDRGGVELLRASAGDEPFGWLYNFVDRGRVLFNLGGFKTEPDNRYKPGLVTQALAIEEHLKGGMDIYDFMAGTDRYKLNLGTRGPDMVTFAIQRKTPLIAAEAAARWVKNKVEHTLRAKHETAPSKQ